MVKTAPYPTKDELVELLKRSVVEWNQWRAKEAEHPDQDEYVDLQGVCLAGVNLTGANLRDVEFNFADLTKADFDSCDLTRADLNGAKLEGANFEGANLFCARGVPERVKLAAIAALIESWDS